MFHFFCAHRLLSSDDAGAGGGIAAPLTVKAYAERMGVSPDKVLAWIASGELFAINVATNPNGERPRWRIPPEAVKEFEAGRRSIPPQPTSKQKPRRRAAAAVKQFF